MLYRFTLTYSGTTTTVIEPKGWTTFKSEINRDFNSHGVVFKYQSGALKLGFADGRDILETAFQNDGFDALVTLTVDQRAEETDAWVNAFTGNAVMKNRELTDMYFSVDFENSTFQQKVINRLNTKVKLDTLLDLDGGTLTGSLTDYTANWNSLRIKQDYVADYRTGGYDGSYVTFSGSDVGLAGADANLYSEFDFQGVIDDELQTFNTNISEQTTAVLPSAVNLVCAIGGTLTFTGSLKYRIQTEVVLDVGASNAQLGYSFRVRHLDKFGALQSDAAVAAVFGGNGATPYVYDSGVSTGSISSGGVTVSAGDRIIFYWRFIGEPVTPDVTEETTLTLTSLFLYYNSRISLSILETSTTNSVKSSLIHDVIERMIYIVSGEDNKLNSEFLGLATQHGYAADGCGGLTALVNGEQLRGITSALSLSLKEVLDSIKAIWGIGWGFEKSGGAYQVRIELLEHFYQDGEIVDLGSPLSIKELDSYKESSFDPLVFNKVEIGYSKFSNDEDYSNSIEDFLTKADYSLPISTIKNSYTQISKLITSGRLIQATFEQTDLTKKWKYDQNTFLVAVVVSASVFVPENDENFSTVTGLDDSTTAYNLRHAPVQMFLNHALIVNSALLGKPLTELIQNTNVAINQDFEIQYDVSSSCFLGDAQRLLRTSVGDISIQNNYSGQRLFDPIQHTFTVAMTATQLGLITDAIENNSTDSTKDLGYLTYKDNAGATQTGYPLNIKWNPNDEIAEVTTLERADNYGI